MLAEGRWPCGTRPAPYPIRVLPDRKHERKPVRKKAEIMKNKQGDEHQ
jgi:hypothetical protein